MITRSYTCAAIVDLVIIFFHFCDHMVTLCAGDSSHPRVDILVLRVLFLLQGDLELDSRNCRPSTLPSILDLNLLLFSLFLLLLCPDIQHHSVTLCEEGLPLTPLTLIRFRAVCGATLPLVLLLQVIRRGGGADWNLALVPVPVVFQGVKDVLGIWMDQISPCLPQWVDNVVDEPNLKNTTRLQ